MELFQADESLTCCVRYLTQLENSSVDPVLSQDSLYYMLITYFLEIVLSSTSHFCQYCLYLLFSPTYATCACYLNSTLLLFKIIVEFKILP